MTVVLLLVFTSLVAVVSFEIGRRWTAGRKEVDHNRYLESREPVGRRGTMKLKSLKIHR